MLKSKLMNYCKLCLSKNVSYKYKIEIYNLYICKTCYVLFINPLPKKRDLINFNKDKYNSLDTKRAYFKKKFELFRRAIRVVETIKKYKSNGKILDVGCSYGFYMKIFKESNYDVEGVELEKRAVDYIKKNFFLKVYKGDINQINLKNNNYDIITMIDIIEHFPNPPSLLKRLRKLLKKNGLLVIQTPNFHSIMSKITKNRWFWLLIPQHLFIFTKKSLTKLLILNNFKILVIKTYDDFDELIKNILMVLKLKDKGISKFLYYPLYHVMRVLKPFSYLWCYLGFGGLILVYAVKE